MNTKIDTVHLQLIRARCVERVEFYSALLECTKGEYRKQIEETIAAMHSTIAAIDAALTSLEVLGPEPEHPLHIREIELASANANAILAAWPEEKP